MTSVAEVFLWGSRIGVVSLDDGDAFAAFEFDSDFLQSGVEVSPLEMPLDRRVYRFPDLAVRAFHGLPGMLSDALPDRYGNALIDAWLATQGRTPESFDAVERLSYTGTRGMGALEFRPATGPRSQLAASVDIEALVALASEVLTHRRDLRRSFAGEDKAEALREILKVGTSAGGARAKAVIAWNPTTNEVRSGQIAAGAGYEYWLIKFDGVQGEADREFADSKGYGAVEYAYFLMATAAGVEMSPCRLLEEGGRRHFMTRRFDRTPSGDKLHMQSLAALAHYDFNQAGLYAYEQAFQVMRRLELPRLALEQQFRRMVFNVLARNQDDHVKNIAFLMDRSGAWSLSPAYDVTWAHNPAGEWTARHQMSINGKRDDLTYADLRLCGDAAGIGGRRAASIFGSVQAAIGRWSEFAEEARVGTNWTRAVQSSLRTALPRA